MMDSGGHNNNRQSAYKHYTNLALHPVSRHNAVLQHANTKYVKGRI